MYANAKGGPSTARMPTLEVSRYPTKPQPVRKYPYRLNFYIHPPIEEITLDDFEVWAIDRLRILTDIETSAARGHSIEETRRSIASKSSDYLPMGSNTTKVAADTEKERRKDQYGHFVLRLAFARSEELRARFLRAETTLFQARFESDDVNERRQFLDSLSFDWATVGYDEKQKYRTELMNASQIRGSEANAKFDAESFFKVHWTRVTDLVATRRVFVTGGWAYVPMAQQSSLVVAEFASRLLKGLEMTAKALPRLDEDERLVPVLDHLSTGFTGMLSSNYKVPSADDGEAVTADMVDDLSKKHFPLCMRTMQMTLNLDHHLKHEGRGQYNLFLKGIGMSIEEVLIFWRKSFSNMSDDTFVKGYRYNIRHGYGLEGGMKDYTPRSCQQIIMGKAPGPGESHGCPFRHYDESSLLSTLQSVYNLPKNATTDIFAMVKKQHYHLACSKVFELQNARYRSSEDPDVSISHPNEYFTESRALEIAFASREKAERGDGMDVDA